jgi:AraC family transcriptional regulator
MSGDVAIERTTGMRDERALFRSGDLGLYPAGRGERIVWRGRARLLHVHIHPHLVARMANPLAGSSELILPRRFRFADPQLSRLAAEADAICATDIARSGLPHDLTDSLVRRLAGMVDCLHRPTSDAEADPAGGGLALMVSDAVRERLPQPLRVRDLARMVGMSEAHFSRRFRRSAGMSPHEFVLRSRIEWARHLLAGGVPPAAVAAECGFADQSHLTRLFAMSLGVTPGSLRPGRTG